MNRQLLDLAFVRRKDRKSLFFIVALLLFSSFIDELYFMAKKNIIESESSVELEFTPYIRQEASRQTGIENTTVSHETAEPSEITKASTTEIKQPASTAIPRQPQRSNDRSFQSTYLSPVGETSPAKSSPSTLAPLPPSDNIKVKSIHINPNVPIIQDLVSLGVPERVAKTWKKYVSAGGNIKSLADLEKIYGVTPELIKRIKANIRFPKSSPKPRFHKVISSIFINQATAIEFARIPGIGPVLSERIIKFRDKLGGFHAYEQLSDVYGIEPEILEKHKSLFLIEKAWLKININECDEATLAAHSYCNFRTAKAITNYREQHGRFISGDDLLKIRIIDEAWLKKIAPYLSY